MKNKTLVWAVDPFDAETKPTVAAVKSLAQWAKGASLQIQPVFILPLPLAQLERGSIAAVDEAQATLDRFVGEYGLSNVGAPALILDDTNTRQGATKELLTFAKKENAAAIALSSHGRAGLKRFVLGSFAEEVLKEAPVPVVFLSRQTPAGKSAFFPTDFSAPSRKAFKKFLAFAAPLKMEVVLFHSVSLPMPVASTMAGAPSLYIPEDYFPREEARARKESNSWISEAKAAGVKARLHLTDAGIGLVTGEVILQAAENTKASFIAMAAQGGPIEHLMFGSAALEVFRSSRFPVWIFGPKTMNRIAGKAPKARPGFLRAKPKKKSKAAFSRAAR